MGTTKTEQFSDQENQMSLIYKSLGHPARLAIALYLAQRGSCVCGDIVDELPLAQATISQHLKELKSAGVIKGSIEGKNTCYCLEPDLLQKAAAFIEALATSTQNQNCC